MPSFGEKLRLERESRNAALEQIATKSEVRLDYLEALENNDFDALPGPAFGKFYIRIYAELLGFDPEPWIADYDRERSGLRREAQPSTPGARLGRSQRAELRKNRWAELCAGGEKPTGESGGDGDREQSEPRQVTEEVVAPEPVEVAAEEPAEPPAEVATEPAAEPPGPTGFYRRVAVVVLAPIGLVAAVWLFFDLARPDRADPVASSSEFVPAPLPERSVEPDPVPAFVPASNRAGPTTTVPDRVDPAPVVASNLSVPEFGLGTRVVGRRLEGRSDRFEEGGVAWFATRVVGGRDGERIRHVWFRAGKPVESIDLALGGSHWRTHSRKTLWGIGEWSVEARDSADRVLARADFRCVRRGS